MHHLGPFGQSPRASEQAAISNLDAERRSQTGTAPRASVGHLHLPLGWSLATRELRLEAGCAGRDSRRVSPDRDKNSRNRDLRTSSPPGPALPSVVAGPLAHARLERSLGRPPHHAHRPVGSTLRFRLRTGPSPAIGPQSRRLRAHSRTRGIICLRQSFCRNG